MAASGEYRNWMKKGESFLAWKQYKQALAAFEKALKAKPNDVIACKEKGKVLMDLGDCNAAVKIFEKAVQLAPDDIECWVLPSLALEEAEEYDAAEDWLRRGTIALAERSPLFFHLGVFLNRRERFEEAIVALNQSLERLNFPDPITLGARSHALENLGRYEEALSDLQRISNYGEFYTVEKLKGDLLEKMQQPEAALAAHQLAARLELEQSSSVSLSSNYS
jgi:tetratricopeptide (TPR) repeat protein